MKYIITHPGRAHRDEFLAIGLIAVITNTIPQVFRRPPTQEELDDPEVWVVDTGGKYNPEKHNFDHHQYKPEDLKCSLTLVASTYQVSEDRTYDDLWKPAPWYRAVLYQDVCGFKTAAKMLEVDITKMDAISAIEAFVLSEFAGNSGKLSVHPTNVKMAKAIIEQKIETSLKLDNRLRELDKRIEIIHITVGDVKGVVLYGPDLEAFGFNAWIDQHGIDNVIATVTRDPRQGGACLYRNGIGEALLDFRRVAEHPACVFCHQAGFMLTVEPGTDRTTIAAIIVNAAERKECTK